MLAFNNDPAVKDMVLAQVKQHEKADEIVQGKYWENGKGCFIGCVAHGSSAETFAKVTGFPLMLSRLAENIFEGLPTDVAKTFPAKIIAAPRPGADLSLVTWKFLHWCITDALEKHGSPGTQRACRAAVSVLADKSQGIHVPLATARAGAADADADYAAWAATCAAYAAEAAYAASAYASAASTAYAARGSASASAYATTDATASETRQVQMDKLIELLASA